MTPSDNKQIALTDQTTSLTSPKGLVDFAGTLQKVIGEKKLYTTIQGKAYVHVEAWQFCGAAMGVIAIVKSTERIVTDNPGEYKYQAEVELRRIENDQLVGSGVAFCTNKERKKASFDEYAVASMAQTRAIGKAYRNAFGWLMKLAGFEATPHEEMDGVGEKDDRPEPNPHPKKEFPEIEREFVEAEEASEPVPVTKLQVQRVKSLMKGMGYTDEKIAEAVLTLDSYEDGENAIAKLKERGGK